MTQEEYYQEIVDEYLGLASDYMEFLLHCINCPAKDEREALARKEFIDNWHEQYKEDVQKIY